MDIIKHDAAAIIDIARRGEAKVVEFPGADGETIRLALVPSGAGIVPISLKEEIDRYRTAPERSSGTATALTIDAFVDIFNRHKGEHSAIFANIVDPDKPRLLAVFDYSENSAKPAFGKHRLVHEFPLTEEWTAWRARNLKGMSQEDFASFIDDRIADLASKEDHPDAETVKELLHGSFATPAQIHTLSRGLSVSATIGVKQAVSLEDGRISVQFEEGEHRGDDGKPIRVPNLFVLNLPIFVGGPAVPIIGRLRYRLQGGKLQWHYDLWQIRTVMRGALLQVLDNVREGTGASVYEGSPEA